MAPHGQQEEVHPHLWTRGRCLVWPLPAPPSSSSLRSSHSGPWAASCPSHAQHGFVPQALCLCSFSCLELASGLHPPPPPPFNSEFLKGSGSPQAAPLRRGPPWLCTCAPATSRGRPQPRIVKSSRAGNTPAGALGGQNCTVLLPIPVQAPSSAWAQLPPDMNYTESLISRMHLILETQDSFQQKQSVTCTTEPTLTFMSGKAFVRLFHSFNEQVRQHPRLHPASSLFSSEKHAHCSQSSCSCPCRASRRPARATPPGDTCGAWGCSAGHPLLGDACQP